MTQEIERELGWDDEIQESGPEFVLLPAGDYNFTVEKFERGRHQGSEKLPPCNMAILTLKVDGGEKGEATIFNRLFLHSKTEGFLSAFFESIGQKQEGQKVKMNWNTVFGAKGRVKLNIDTYNDKERNQVDRFLPYEEYQKHAGLQGQQQQQYQTPPTQQQAPQQQTQQQPFPTSPQQQQPNTQQGQQQQGNYTPGTF